MGNCNDIKAPIVANRCSNYGNKMGSKQGNPGGAILQNFCTLAGVGGKKQRQRWCDRVGDHEWRYDGNNEPSNGCFYNSCHPYETQPTGCCGGCCGIIGKGVACKREKFTGSPVPCCLQDYGGCNVLDGSVGPPATEDPPFPGDYSTTQMNLCFSDVKTDDTYPAGINEGRVDKICYYDKLHDPTTQDNCQNTCAPCTRDITSNDNTKILDGSTLTTCGAKKATTCQDVILNYCTGKDLPVGDSSWLYRWMNPDGTYLPNGCLKVIPRNLFNIPSNGTLWQACQRTKAYFDTISNDPTCTPITYPQSESGFEYARKLLEATLARYTKDGFLLGSIPGTPGHNPFQDIIYNDICCRFPNLCASILGETCAMYTAQQLSYNIPASNICGCYLPNNEYEKYVDEFQVNVECTPLCNRPGTIPLANPDGTAVRCRQDICIIDDLAINLTTTNITGDINITQMCANCSDNTSYDSRASASCDCTIAANNINVTGNEIRNVSINNTCTSTSCSLINPVTGLTDIIPCSQVPEQRKKYDQEYQQQQASLKKQRMTRNYIIIGIIVAVIILIIVLYLLINQSNKKKKANLVNRTKDSGNRPREPAPSNEGRYPVSKSNNPSAKHGPYRPLTKKAPTNLSGTYNSAMYQEGIMSADDFQVNTIFRSIDR